MGEMAARVTERLTVRALITGATGLGIGFGFGLGLGLTTPVNPMFPKLWGAIGAWAAAGIATVAARVTGVAVATWEITGAAEAGSASEATMAPEMTITAEALLAGFAECERADESEDAELRGLGARWRPVFWLDIVRKPLQAPTRSAVGFG